jgi:hypothetical protein
VPYSSPYSRDPTFEIRNSILVRCDATCGIFLFYFVGFFFKYVRFGAPMLEDYHIWSVNFLLFTFLSLSDWIRVKFREKTNILLCCISFKLKCAKRLWNPSRYLAVALEKICWISTS